ncbi:MAG TPA: ABC transporter permease [Holophagaceae bacterium]
MRGALLIAKKEFLELSKNRKALFFAFVLPVLMMPAIIGIMAKMNQREANQNKSKPSRIYLSDPSHTLEGLLAADPKDFTLVPKPEGNLKQAILDQKLEMAVEVDPSAADALHSQRTFTISALQDDTESASNLALKRLKKALEPQEKTWVQSRLQALNASSQLAEPIHLEVKNAADQALEMGKILGMILPYLLMLFMFMGSMQPGIYSTAGEKERHTLLSLMATRLPRTQIMLGKLIYIFSMGAISAVLNLLSMAVTIPYLAGTNPSATSSLSTIAAVANPMTLGLTFLIMVPLGLFFSNFILLMGVQAKNTIEAGSAITPGMMLVVFLGVFMMSPGVDKMSFLAYVPVVNVCLAMRKLFNQQPDWLQYWGAFAMTVGLSGLMTLVSARLLVREKALFKA